MKITLQFTEEEEGRAKMAINGDSYCYALERIYEMCRQRQKHYENTEEIDNFLDMVRGECQIAHID